ncbi:MAG: competence protein ComK [Bacillota bacterium]
MFLYKKKWIEPYENQRDYPFFVYLDLCTPISSKGRKGGTKKLINITHKAPIVIDTTSSLLFFLTTSPSRPQCIWLSHVDVVSNDRLDSNIPRSHSGINTVNSNGMG